MRTAENAPGPRSPVRATTYAASLRCPSPTIHLAPSSRQAAAALSPEAGDALRAGEASEAELEPAAGDPALRAACPVSSTEPAAGELALRAATGVSRTSLARRSLPWSASDIAKATEPPRRRTSATRSCWAAEPWSWTQVAAVIENMVLGMTLRSRRAAVRTRVRLRSKPSKAPPSSRGR
ncbi:hypothetical protein [Kitasatospora albolonga]|uniref:hypothetical protein n=1 Tax=Kitasatospora albolonga TaxID=68173 RepID=UPI0031E690C0